MVIPINVVFDPLNQVSRGVVGDVNEERISPIGIVSFGFLWGDLDPWVPCFDPLTSSWSNCFIGVTSAWSAVYAGVTTSWTEC